MAFHPHNPISPQIIAKATPTVAAVLCLTVSAIGYVFLVAPEMEKYRPGGPLDVEAKRQVVQNRKQYLSDLKKLNQLYEEYGSGEQNVVSSIIPNDKDVSSLFATYELLAKQMKIGLESIDIVSQDGKVKNIPGAREIVISLKFSGVNYTKFKEVLSVLETYGRFTDVLSFDIQPESQFANINIRTYYFLK